MRALLLATAVAVAAVAPGADAQEGDLGDTIPGQLLRQVCDLQWVEGVCEATGYPEPQYATDADPSPGAPLALRVGALHEHSGYSDGTPDSRPSDYFAAGRTGHNVADDGADTGVRLDYILSSEHSDNEKLPITTAAECLDPSGVPDAIAALDLEGIGFPLACSQVDQPDHYRKWSETLRQAAEGTELDDAGNYVGFTGMRGFEWTNDYFNHLNVFFSRNVVNVKIDGSYLSMDFFWNWLREPVERGGGADALVTFNHPRGLPHLTPFDDGLPHGQLLQDLLGGANWNDVAYVPDVDERVAGMEVNGGDDLSWYVRALTNGWHIGPVAAEDEHQREWSASTDGKTLMLTRGRSPRDYYFAFQHHRTVALADELVGGAPGQLADVPSILFYADGTDVQDPAATLLGSTITAGGTHELRFEATGLPPGSVVVLLGNTIDEPRALGTAGDDGTLLAASAVANPASGEDWWFAVVCPPGTADCGRGEAYHAVTAPIWLAPAAAPAPGSAPTGTGAPGVAVAGSAGGTIPTTGGTDGWLPWALLAAAFVAYRAAVSMSSDIWNLSASTPRARP